MFWSLYGKNLGLKSCFYSVYKCLPCSKDVSRINIQNFLWSPNADKPESKTIAISMGDKFSVSNSRPSGKTGPFLVHCVSLLHIHIFLVPWRRFRTVQLTEEMRMFLAWYVTQSQPRQVPWGAFGGLWDFCSWNQAIFHSSLDGIVAASLRKLQFFFGLFRKSFLKILVSKKQTASFPA